MNDIRDQVKNLVKASGMKETSVAKRVGLTDQQLRDILCKRRKLDANELISICDTIGFSVFIQKKESPGAAHTGDKKKGSISFQIDGVEIFRTVISPPENPD